MALYSQTGPFVSVGNGRINNRQLADGTYTIRVTLHKEDGTDEVLSGDAILDTKPPRISSVFANEDPNLLLTNGTFINVPLRTITVVPDVDDGSPVDLGAERTNVVLKKCTRGRTQRLSQLYNAAEF